MAHKRSSWTVKGFLLLPSLKVTVRRPKLALLATLYSSVWCTYANGSTFFVAPRDLMTVIIELAVWIQKMQKEEEGVIALY